MSRMNLEIRCVSVALAVVVSACGTQSSVQQQGSAAKSDAETKAARAEIEATTADISSWTPGFGGCDAKYVPSNFR